MAATPATDFATRMQALVREGIDLERDRISTKASTLWSGLSATGTRLWLDTGDIAAAERSWTAEFSGLTTNNTLLNKEVQTGAYDSFVPTVAALTKGLDQRTAVLEIAFALNARHGLRLVARFGSWVSVELHTDLAHDAERSIAYGVRYWNICPERFIVKIPLTASGLVAARELGSRGIPINLTLGFSARHNALATAMARPRYVNVFLGRLNAYIGDHQLGDPRMVGEKALWASQLEVRALDRGQGKTLQIAASLREAKQLEELAGCDVITMPTAVSEGAVKGLAGSWNDHRAAARPVSLTDASAIRAETLWELSANERKLVDAVALNRPKSGSELIALAKSLGCPDIFPALSAEDLGHLAKDGKIPKHARWADRIRSGELAIDTLLNLAALASFTADQAALDARIVSHMASAGKAS